MLLLVMFRQISSVSSRPKKPQFIAVLDARPVQADSIGMVLKVFPTAHPHGEKEYNQALRQAFGFENACKQHGIRCRIETVNQNLPPQRHVNPFTDVEGRGAPNRFSGTIKVSSA